VPLLFASAEIISESLEGEEARQKNLLVSEESESDGFYAKQSRIVRNRYNALHLGHLTLLP
jgi:hypothetical protein